MIGRAWSIKVMHPRDISTRTLTKSAGPSRVWKSGTGYNYGMLPPSYPVPATLEYIGLISTLWIMGYASSEMFLALCFDADNKYID